MQSPFDDDEAEFQILVNEEGQYSLWPSFKEPPPGWRVTGPSGTRRTCLEWIEAMWTDIRPQSLRGAGGEGTRSPSPAT